MGKRIIREVTYRAWDEEKQEDRIYSGSLIINNSEDKKNKVEVFSNGDSLDVLIEDIPLLVKVLQEFC